MVVGLGIIENFGCKEDDDARIEVASLCFRRERMDGCWARGSDMRCLSAMVVVEIS